MKKPKLTVLDLSRGKTFSTTPRNVGGVRDFNTVEADGVSPDEIERGLSGFEGQVAEVLRNLSSARTLDDEMTRALLMNLMALIAVRNPQNREQMAEFQSETMKNMLSLSVQSKERWEATIQQMEEDGVDSIGEVSYEKMRDFVERNEYNINVNREYHIGIEMEEIDAVLPYLFGRDWTLLIAGENTGPFLTSDRPVALTWKYPEQVPPMFRESPGFGMQATRLVFPVSKEMAIVGEFESGEVVAMAEPKAVAAVNSQVAFLAVDQVYAPSLQFSWLTPKGEIKKGSDLLAFSKGEHI